MKAVPYTRVSDSSQVEGHSLDAQERLFRELCKSRGWEAGKTYREEGKSAHVDSINKRPVFRQLLDDAEDNQFDVVVVHTLDRWSRNLKVTIESINRLTASNVGFVSITENIDWSNPQGRLFAQMLGAFAEYYSGALSTHVKKGKSEQAHKGLHLGGIPIGYESCWGGRKGDRQLRCNPEHSGGVHPQPEEANAVKDLFCSYYSGGTTLSQQAGSLNERGFRTRNMHKLAGPDGTQEDGPRLFTVASVRGILHNSFYAEKIIHKDQILPGVHESLVTEEIFNAVQVAMKRNSGRSETLHPRPEREYLLKGLIRCAHCLLPMWAQTYKNGHRYYREQKGSRGIGYCVGKSRSMACGVPDEQMGRIVDAIILPEAWMDRTLSKIHLAGAAEKLQHERIQAEQRLKRLGKTYVDGLYSEEDYRREKRSLEDKLASLVEPGVDATKEAGKLLENLPDLWGEANLSERRNILLSMLDAVYVDTVEEKAIVALRPKPAFRPLFEIATTRKGSDVVLINEPPQADNEPEAADSCFWWRRGRVELLSQPPWRTHSVTFPKPWHNSPTL
jgi:DNA invertase Pin-like site-specific DNA recombinase